MLKFEEMGYKQEDFTQYVAAIYDNDIIQQHYGAFGIRKLLSRPRNPPIQIVIDSGLVPKFIKYAQQT